MDLSRAGSIGDLVLPYRSFGAEMTTTTLVIVIFAGMAFVVVVFLVGMQVQKVLNDLRSTRERLAKLEGERKTRNPHRTNDGLEDAMAVLNDATWESLKTLDYIRARTDQATRILQVIRAEPDRYDSEQPNSKQAR